MRTDRPQWLRLDSAVRDLEDAHPRPRDVGEAGCARPAVRDADLRPGVVSAVQGGLDFTHTSGFYLGTWASNVKWVKDFNGATKGSVELGSSVRPSGRSNGGSARTHRRSVPHWMCSTRFPLASERHLRRWASFSERSQTVRHGLDGPPFRSHINPRTYGLSATSRHEAAGPLYSVK